MAKPFKKNKKLPKFGKGSIYDESSQQPYGENTQKMAGYGQMAGNFGTAMGANEDQFGGDFRSQNDQQEGAVMGAVGKIGPVGQVIQGAYQVGQSIGTKIRARAEATDETGHLKDEKAAKRNAVIGGLFDPFKAFKTRSSYAGGFSDLSGKGYTKHLESEAQKRIAEENAPMLAEQQAETQHKLQYGTYAQGGRIYDSGNGIPNAEIEKQEVTSYTQGGVEAHDLNTHENATPDNQISLQKGDMILSDKIKDPLNGNKTFAKVGKPYDTKKEEKILNDIKASNLSKKTAELNFMSKKTLFQQTFERQEQLKADKVRKYASKLGVDLNPGQANLGIMPEFAYGGYQVDPLKPSSSKTVSNVRLNQDPSQLPQGFNYSAYNQFQKYLSSKDFVKDKRMDTFEGKKAYTDELINDFNTNSDYAKRFPQNKITPDYVKAVQEYHKKSDPNVVVDGWVGSQTSQMTFPVPTLNEKMTDPNKQYYDATWGNKKYKLPANKYLIDPTTKKAKWNASDLELNENRYGGIQKFGNAGMFDDEEPSLGYTPKTLAEKYKMQQASLSKPKASIYNQETDPNGDSENWSDFNSPEFKKENQEMLARAQEAAKSEQSPKGSNWKEGAYQGVTGLASNMGEMFAMYKASKPVETQQRYDYKPEVLNNTAADRAAWRMYKNTAEGLKNAGLSGGQYASNLGANRASLTEQLDTQRINRENVNVGIRNDAQRTNIAGRYSVDDINARNRAAKENLQLKATERMGSNITQQSKDYRAAQQEKEMLPFMKQAFSDPAFLKMYSDYMASKGVKGKK